MHEPFVATAETPDDTSVSDVEPTPSVTTGVSSVDAVIRAVEPLDDLPVAEHAAVYEQAHDALRRALDAPADA
ncbi:MAG: hypothetical protein ACI379_01245 [Nocardioides sp.]|uniref:hypothetical protein n=1 Tax=Nocardioides sp. TaxID=35761 RepID=UPI003F0D88D2